MKKISALVAAVTALLLLTTMIAGCGQQTAPTTPSSPSTPSAPSLSLSNKTCDSNAYVVHLSWTDVDGEDGYRVYRDGSLIATVGAGSSSYDDTSPDYSSHAYRVEAYNAAGAASSGSKSSEGCLY